MPAMIGMPAVDGLGERGDHGGLLVGGQEGALAGVAEHDQALDAVDAGEPRPQAPDGVEVDGFVAVEGGDRGRE